MSSFLQDFDLREGGVATKFEKFDIINYRTIQPKQPIAASLEDNDSQFCAETPFKRGSGSRASQQDSKKGSANGFHTGTGSRQSLQNRDSRVTPTTSI